MGRRGGGGGGGVGALALIKILINTHQGNFTKMVFNARQPQSNALTLISAIQNGDYVALVSLAQQQQQQQY